MIVRPTIASLRGAVVVLVATLVLALGATVASAAPTPAASSAPTIHHVTLSVHHLPSRGGRVTVSARVHRATHCTLRARPELRRLPLAKSCTAKTVRWKVRLPANPGAASRVYHLRIAAHGAHHRLVTRVRTVTVEPAPPARARAFTQSAQQLASVGGTVDFHAAVANASRCKLSVTPAILGLPSEKNCPGSSVSWAATLPPNAVDAPASYRFSFTAFGAHGTTAVRQLTVTVAAQDPTCPGQTATATPTTSAYFNDPTTNNAQDQQAIVNAEINLICSVSPPVGGVASRIRVAMYEYQLEAVSQALLWAHEYRSADVHVALDGANYELENTDGTIGPNPALVDLQQGANGMTALPANAVVLCGVDRNPPPIPPPGGDLRRGDRPHAQPAAASAASSGPAETACAGNNILHTKLLIVSSIDTAHDSAVFTGAQNYNTHGEVSGFNNGLQVVGNHTLYRQNATYLQYLTKNKANPALGESLASGPVATPAGAITDDYFPRNSPAAFPSSNAYNAANDRATDATAKLLDKVSCAPPGPFAGDHTGGHARTKVQLAMYTYNSRPLVTHDLTALANAGCEVQILYTNMSSSTMSALTAAGIEPIQLSDDAYAYPDGSGTVRVFIHDKYLLISGALDASGGKTVPNQKIVLTGSENLTQYAIHQNDDQTMQVQQTAAAAAGSTPIYDAYEANWTHIAAVIAALPPPTP